MLCGPAAKIPFSAAPEDDRNLPDMHLALYNDTIVFDQATKLVYVICWVHLDDDTTSVSISSSNGSSNGASASSSSRAPEALREAFDAGKQRLQGLVRQLSTPPPSLAPAQVDMALSQLPAPPGKSNVTKQQFLDAVLAAKEYILVSWASAGCIPAEVHLEVKGTGSGPMALCQTASATSGQIDFIKHRHEATAELGAPACSKQLQCRGCTGAGCFGCMHQVALSAVCCIAEWGHLPVGVISAVRAPHICHSL